MIYNFSEKEYYSIKKLHEQNIISDKEWIDYCGLFEDKLIKIYKDILVEMKKKDGDSDVSIGI